MDSLLKMLRMAIPMHIRTLQLMMVCVARPSYTALPKGRMDSLLVFGRERSCTAAPRLFPTQIESSGYFEPSARLPDPSIAPLFKTVPGRSKQPSATIVPLLTMTGREHSLSEHWMVERDPKTVSSPTVNKSYSTQWNGVPGQKIRFPTLAPIAR